MIQLNEGGGRRGGCKEGVGGGVITEVLRFNKVGFGVFVCVCVRSSVCVCVRNVNYCFETHYVTVSVAAAEQNTVAVERTCLHC